MLGGSLVQQQVSSLNASNPRMTFSGYQASNGRIQSLGTDANAYLMNHGRLDRLRSPPARHGGTKVQLHTVGEYSRCGQHSYRYYTQHTTGKWDYPGLAGWDGQDRTGQASATTHSKYEPYLVHGQVTY